MPMWPVFGAGIQLQGGVALITVRVWLGLGVVGVGSRLSHGLQAEQPEPTTTTPGT